MNKQTLYAAIKNVAEDLCALSKEEFARELDAHQDGDIGKILLETRALDVGEIEAEQFDHYSVPYAETQHIDLSCLQHDTNLIYSSGYLALHGIAPTLVLGAVTVPLGSFAALIPGWSSEVTSVRLQKPFQMTFFTHGLPGYEITKAESYYVGRKIVADPEKGIASNKDFSVNDEEEYKLAA